MSWESVGAVFWAVLITSSIMSMIAAFWKWWTERKPLKDERIRVTALDLAIQSHGIEDGELHDRCFTARARVFEEYLRTGDVEDKIRSTN